MTRIYHADFGTYAVWMGLCGLPLLAVPFNIAEFGWSSAAAHGLIKVLLVIVAVEVVIALWLSRYRLMFTESTLSYRSWRASWSAPYASIAEVVPSRVTPIAKVPIGAYVKFKDGRSELVYTKAFSLVAIRDLFALVHTA
jgi:hypothetical protein